VSSALTRTDVALVPGQVLDPAGSVCVVVDVLRASSSIVTLLERGAAPVIAAADIDKARALHGRLPDYLLCGERDGLPPEGFDFGNSPAEFARAELAGRGAILATSNGTRLLARLADAPAVIVGSLLNRTAAAKAAVEIARERGLDIVIGCSAAYGGTTFVLEDALGAGAIVDAAVVAEPSVEAGDAARFARDAFLAAQPRLGDAVASAYHARELADGGFGEDVAYCSRVDVSLLVPILERGEDGLLALRQYRS
jgi:2-phosphosulfolactate phosphatase